MTRITWMKLGFYGAVTVAFLFVLVISGRAEGPALNLERLLYDENNNFDPFPTKQPKEFMSGSELRRYQKTLNEGDCQTAEDLLTAAFVRAYPQFRRAKPPRHCSPPGPYDCLVWENFVFVKFHGLGFCKAELDWRTQEKKLRLKRLSLPKYSMSLLGAGERYEDSDIEARDRALNMIASKAELGYVPALEKIAELIRRGDIFDVGDDVEYYVLARACFHGANCDNWRGRLTSLKELVGNQRAKQIDALAQKNEEEQPRLNDLLLGKSF